MTDKKPTTPKDAIDFASLWKDPELGDGITTGSFHTIPVGKPKNFFRTHPDQAYRRRTEIYVHKPEGVIDEQTFIIAPSMQGRIEEATPCTLVTVMYRDGTPRIWRIKHPRDGEKDNESWISARSSARTAIDRWVKVIWKGNRYMTRDAQPGYAPDPDWSKLPTFDELAALAFGEHGVISDTSHPIYRELFGAPTEEASGDDDI